MKVRQLVAASIVLGFAAAMPARVEAAEETEATCATHYLLCVNEASQIESDWMRTWAEQKCTAGWFACLRRQAFEA